MFDNACLPSLAVVPRGLEPRTLRVLAVRSNQLSYETCGFGVGDQDYTSCAAAAPACHFPSSNLELIREALTTGRDRKRGRGTLLRIF